MTEKKGKGSETAEKANAKAAKEGKSNPCKSSAAQANRAGRATRKHLTRKAVAISRADGRSVRWEGVVAAYTSVA